MVHPVHGLGGWAWLVELEGKCAERMRKDDGKQGKSRDRDGGSEPLQPRGLEGAPSPLRNHEPESESDSIGSNTRPGNEGFQGSRSAAIRVAGLAF